MIQNGIRFEGIKALADALGENLEVLNLSDNIMTEEGGRVMADALVKAKSLKVLNFSDCLLKAKGFGFILKTLRKHGLLKNLQRMDFQGNEIGGHDIVNLLFETFRDRSLDYRRVTLDLSCNEFGNTNKSYLLEELNGLVDLQIK